MITLRSVARVFAAATLGAALGCGADRATAPTASTTFDDARAVADLTAMDAVLTQPRWLSLGTLVRRPDVSAANAERVATETARRMLAAAPSGDAAAAAGGALRPDALGKTYVYDPAARRYVPAPGRPGAPPNGVRFVLYAVDPVRQEPVTSAEVGYADLIDEGIGAPSGIALRLVVVSQGITFLDYRFAIDGSPTAGVLSVDGFAFDGTTRLRFHIEAHGSKSEGGAVSEVAFQFAVPERGFAVTGKVEGAQAPDGSAQTQHVQLAVNTGEAVIALDGRSDGHAVDATVRVNGAVFATIRGDGSAPEIRGMGGRELSADEMQALGRMMGLVGGALQMFGGLLAPIEGILALTRLP